MLKTSVLHPQLLSVLGRAGHLSKVLIADGNYPASTMPHPRAEVVWANFVPGVIDGVTALRMVTDLVPIQSVSVMEPEREGAYAMATDPPIWEAYGKVLVEGGYRQPMERLTKPQFNEAAAQRDVCLVIATAELAIFANVLVTIGVVQ